MSGNEPHGASAADAAAWAGVEIATERSREQLRLLLGQDDVLAAMARRFANVGAPQRAGHVFEWQQELTFNLDAIAKGSAARAVVTEWLGEPHAPADLRVHGADGDVFAEVQAKVVASVAGRLGARDGLAAPKYDGMQLLTPSDHTTSADDLLGRRLAMPRGPLHDRYDDVRERLTDRIRVGHVESDPVTSAQLDAIADDPGRLVAERVLVDQLTQVGQAAVGGAAVTAVLAAAGTLAAGAVRSGSLSELPWGEAGRRAAAGAVRGATVAFVAQGISLVGQHGTDALGAALAEGALPGALARGVWDIAAVAHGVATGRLSERDAAVEVAQVVTRSTMVWAGAAVGQAVIPVPVVGALVGGVVGQIGASLVQQGLQLAVVGRSTSSRWDDAYDELILEAAATELRAERQREDLRRVTVEHDTAFAEQVLPRLERLGRESQQLDVDTVLRDLADITRHYAATPLFTSMAEFDAFMADDDLLLDLRFRR